MRRAEPLRFHRRCFDVGEDMTSAWSRGFGWSSLDLRQRRARRQHCRRHDPHRRQLGRVCGRHDRRGSRRCHRRRPRFASTHEQRTCKLLHRKRHSDDAGRGGISDSGARLPKLLAAVQGETLSPPGRRRFPVAPVTFPEVTITARVPHGFVQCSSPARRRGAARLVVNIAAALAPIESFGYRRVRRSARLDRPLPRQTGSTLGVGSDQSSTVRSPPRPLACSGREWRSWEVRLDTWRSRRNR